MWDATRHGVGAYVVLARPRGEESGRLAVPQGPQLPGPCVPAIHKAGQHVALEEAHVAATENNVEGESADVTRPPALQLAGQRGISLGRVLVFVENDEQRTTIGHAGEGRQGLRPIDQRGGP